MHWVTDEEDSLHSVKACACEFRHGVHGCGSALAVAFKNEALAGVGLDTGLDFTDNVGGAKSRVLGEIGGIDCVVDLASGHLGCDPGIDGAEARRFALDFASATSVDDGVRRASGTLLNVLDRGSEGRGREDRQEECGTHDAGGSESERKTVFKRVVVGLIDCEMD